MLARSRGTIEASLARMISSQARIAKSALRVQWPPIRGGSAGWSDDASERRMRGFMARLPRDVPYIAEGRNVGARSCDVCGRDIILGATAYELHFAAAAFCLDRTCFARWTLARGSERVPRSAAILVIEDEADLLTTYERLLRRMSFDVLTAARGHEGLGVLAANRVALVIADLKLPDMDGIELVRALRAGPNAPAVIVVSGFTAPAWRRAAMEAGAAGYLAKPFSLAALTALIREVVVTV
jgi:CheY-like chemotaxis protein